MLEKVDLSLRLSRAAYDKQLVSRAELNGGGRPKWLALGGDEKRVPMRSPLRKWPG
jgi:hypothetical protein